MTNQHRMVRFHPSITAQYSAAVDNLQQQENVAYLVAFAMGWR